MKDNHEQAVPYPALGIFLLWENTNKSRIASKATPEWLSLRLGIAEFIVPTGSFFHAQTHVSFHIIEELSPNVRMILKREPLPRIELEIGSNIIDKNIFSEQRATAT